jgi:hypothetical protein
MTKKKKPLKSAEITVLKTAPNHSAHTTEHAHGERAHQGMHADHEYDFAHHVEKTIDFMTANLDAIFDCSGAKMATLDNLKEQLHDYNNNLLSFNNDLMQRFLSCTTFAEMQALRETVMQFNMDINSKNMEKISHIVRDSLNQITEPLNQRLQDNIDFLINYNKL